MTLTWVILYTKNVLKSEMHHPVRYYHKLKLWGTLLSLLAFLIYLIKFCSSLYKLICEIFVLYLGTYIYAVSIFNFVTFAKCLRAITNITFVLLSRRAPLTLMRLQKPLWLRPFLTRFKLWLALRSLTDKRSPNQRPMVRDTSPKAECAPGACSQISSSCAQPRRFPQWVDWFNFSWISSSAQNSPGLMRNSGRRSNLLPGCLANPKTQSSPHIQFFFGVVHGADLREEDEVFGGSHIDRRLGDFPAFPERVRGGWEEKRTESHGQGTKTLRCSALVLHSLQRRVWPIAHK